MFNNETYLGWKKENLHEEKQLPLIPSMVQFFDALRLGRWRGLNQLNKQPKATFILRIPLSADSRSCHLACHGVHVRSGWLSFRLNFFCKSPHVSAGPFLSEFDLSELSWHLVVLSTICDFCKLYIGGWLEQTKHENYESDVSD